MLLCLLSSPLRFRRHYLVQVQVVDLKKHRYKHYAKVFFVENASVTKLLDILITKYDICNLYGQKLEFRVSILTLPKKKLGKIRIFSPLKPLLGRFEEKI